MEVDGKPFQITSITNEAFDTLTRGIEPTGYNSVEFYTIATLVVCADCDYRHDKSERIEKKGKVWTTYHCPKCGSESTCRVS
jgi:Zn finger protein HypA/HybF involved in hydrogenase expression